MAENISKGFCYRPVSGVFCPECKKEDLIYIGCDIHLTKPDRHPDNHDVVHYYHCPNCNRELSNLILNEF